MIFPLNQSQKGVYYASIAAEQDCNYTISVLFHFPLHIHLPALAQAIEKTVLCHPHLFDRIVIDEKGEPLFSRPDSIAYHQDIIEAASIEEIQPMFAQELPLDGDCLFRLFLIRTPQQYYLSVNIHHILIDGCGFEQLLLDISAAYAGKDLQPEPIDAVQINKEEEEKRSSDVYDIEKEWYEQTFGGVESVSLPQPDVCNSNTIDYRKESYPLHIDPAQVQALAQKMQVSTSIPYTAAFALALHTFTGDEDVSYATFYHSRKKEQLRTLSMLVRTLPMIHHLGEIQTVEELLHQTYTLLQEVRRKDTIGFGEVCNQSGYNGDVTFIYQGRITDTTLRLDGTDYHWQWMSKHEPGIKLNLQVREDSEGKAYLQIAWPAHEYSQHWVKEFVESYDYILEQLCHTQRLADIRPTSPTQMERLHQIGNPGTYNSREWEGETIVSLFGKNVQAYPNNIALKWKEKTYTYLQLDEATDRLANVIASHITPEDRKGEHLPIVAIMIPRNDWMVLAPLAAMKAGCAYQPLDASYPAERLNYMLQDSQTKLLITTPELQKIADAYTGDVLEATDELLWSNPIPKKTEVHPITGKDLLIILYTSGSTGVPKGVMLSHDNILSYIHCYQRFMEYKATTQAAAYASFGFDASMMDVYPTILAGGTLHIIPEEIRLDLSAIGEFVEQNGITNLFMTTQVAQQFALTYDKIGQLRFLGMGGEKMMSMPLPSGYKVYNLYGPTECSVGVTAKYVEHNETNIPIGRPTDDTQLYVVDKALHHLPIGAPGELLVVSKQVGMGYLNQKEKTAQAFIDFEGQRAYRTGDIVRFRPDGDIEFVGRKDGQVKIRGFRIELKEVESVIREYDGIQDVTVQAYEYNEGGKYIVAYIVSPQKVDIKALEQFIMERKPPYMVPAHTMQLERIPLNVNQKVDRRALPKPDIQPANPSTVRSAAPLNVLEQQIQQIIVACIHQDDFDITTPLIYAGMTSITAMKIAAKLYKTFGINLDVKELIKRYSLQDIENAILQQMMEGKEPESAAPTEHTDTPQSAPLTGAQQGIYLDWEANRKALQYNVPLVVQLPQNTHHDRLQQALQAILDAHPALQVHLSQEDKQVVMVQDKKALVIAQEKSDTVLHHEDLQDYMQSFDLMEGPLYRVVEVHDPKNVWLLIDIHHIVYDGLSSAILLSEFNKAYQGEELSTENHSLLNYAKEEEQTRKSERYKEAQQYFDALMEEVEPTHYPESEGIPANSMGVGHEQSRIRRQAIEQACHSLGITVNSYMATVLSQVLHRVTREEKVLFTTISNGRNDMRLMDTIGMFVQTMIVVDKKADGTIGERMQAMHQQLQETLRRDFYPFSEIASQHHIAPQIIYAFQDGVMDSTIEFDGEQAPIYALALGRAKAPLSIQIKGSDKEYVVEAEYDRSIYSAEDMQRLCRLFTTMAEQCTQTRLQPKALTLTNPEETQTILQQSYGGDLAYNRQRTISQWVQHYAGELPEHTAVVDHYGEWSYQELNHRGNLLGTILREKGVKKDTLVGIMLPRIKEFLSSVVAIHKAGGAYLPLDSEYPNDRLVYMLENSESQVLITTHELYDMKCHEGDFKVPQVIFIEDIDWTPSAAEIDYSKTDGLAYMIYTSGSTGKPKGVMLEHRNLMAFAGWRTKAYFRYTPDNQFLCHPSFCFDASICDLLIPLFAGSTIHILHEDLRKDLDGMALYIREHHIDGASMSTQLGMALLNSADVSLQYLEMGGEKLVQTTPRSVQKVNGYGPTEFACCSSYHVVKEDETEIPIGRPAPNSWSVIVDSEGNLMPWGMAGELCLIGEQMARGYWHLPEKTEQVFTPCTFMKEKHMYHTGDLARYNTQGQLEYLGRIDHQVKLRGFRIEMGEIEAQMASFPDVTASIAMVQEIGGAKHLVGYYTANTTIDSEKMKAHLKQSLTAYMVPDAFVQMAAFPLTPNGKIDRKKLPIPELERSVEYIAPRNELEEQLCTIFAHITGAEKVGIKDDFFDIGGTSLLAIKAVIDITNLGKKVVYGDLFRLKTPEALAAHIDPSLSQATHEEDAYYRFADYDYTRIDQLLNNNQLPTDEMTCRPLGNVLLAGATGFMGIHVLDYLMRNTDSNVYCLVRPRGKYSGESRLMTMMVYYLRDTHSTLIGQRIHVIEDDITNANLYQTLSSIHIDTILNCAALVKHFVVGTEMDKVNVEGVANLITVAEQQKARLIHVSTYSSAGYVPTEYRLPYTEQQLYIGQCTDNEYVRTKFLSERLVLQATAEGRIEGKVMRVGNLMARAEDGEFQINLHSNAFLNNLKSLQSLGLITSEIMAASMEMSPIDCVARAICLLSGTPREMVVFHPYNNFSICRSVMVDEMEALGYPIRLATAQSFQKQLQEAMQDESRSEEMQGVIHYTTNIANGLYALGASNFYTTQVLLWLGFHWPMTTNQYIRSLLKGLDGLAFFDK